MDQVQDNSQNSFQNPRDAENETDDSQSIDLHNASRITLHQSCALLLGLAVLEALPNAVRIQATVSEDGFGYDFIFPTKSASHIDEQILPHILQKLKRLIQQDIPFEMKTMMRENAVQFFIHNKLPIQAELIEGMRENLIGLCQIGEAYDLCQKETLQTSREIYELTLYSVKAETLYYPALGYIEALRIKGAAFFHRKELKEFVKRDKLAQKNNPVELCKTLNLIELQRSNIQEKDSIKRPFWLPAGMNLRDTILERWKAACKKRGFGIVSSPRIAEFSTKKRQVSPIEDVFEKNDDVLIFEDEEKEFTFSSPLDMHTYLFNSRYREGDPPQRYAELIERELSLFSKDTDGLFRTKSCFGDALHIFCRPQEVANELISSLQFIQEMGTLFTLDYSYSLLLPRQGKGKEFSKGNEFKDRGVVAVFIQALEKTGCEYQSTYSKGFLAGPRIELYAQDVRGGKWLVAALGMAEEEKSMQRCTLAMSTFFSLERVVALLVERDGGVPSFLLAMEPK